MKSRAHYIHEESTGVDKNTLGLAGSVSVDSSVLRRAGRGFGVHRIFGAVMLVLIVMPFVFISGFVAFSSMNDNSHHAEASPKDNFTQWFMCDIAPGILPDSMQESESALYLAFQEAGRVYQWTNSDDIPFYLQSKSAIVGAHNQVGSYLPNRIISLSTGPSFEEVNDWVVDNVHEYDSDREDYEEFDSAVAVSPYDRFGLAGLQWSSYGGEWKYYQIDACNADAEEANDPGLNKFYEGRLEPRATFENTGLSEDPRVEQFNIGWISKVAYGVMNTVANHVFFIAKLIVSITITLVSFAFGDIVSMMGVDVVLFGSDGDGSGGIFATLYHSIFTPLIVVAFILTAMYMIWHGIVRQQYKKALLEGLLRSTICLIVGLVILMTPAFFISLPNNIAVFTQSLIMSAFSSESPGGDGLCETSIHEVNRDIRTPNPGNISVGNSERYIDQANVFMESIGASISSSLGCTLWQTLLLEPWAQGQFGGSFDELYAEGFAPEGAGSIGNNYSANNPQSNGSWVGNAAVPTGDDEYIHNWALFQLSTQTDSHYNIDEETISEDYTAEVNNDWWRVVDALSNYEERNFSTDLSDVGTTEGDAAVVFPEGVISDVELDTVEGVEIVGGQETRFWDSWIGNNGGQRFMMAFTSIIFSIMTMAPLLFLAFLSVMYSIGLAILVALSPLMFLFACWAGKGWSIFTDWAQLLLNTLLMRIGLGVLMVLVISIIMSTLNMIDTLGFFRSFIALIIIAWLMLKNKDKLLRLFAFVRFSASAGGLSELSSRVARGSAIVPKAGFNAVAAGSVGFLDGLRRGKGGAMLGAKTGFATSLKNEMYRRSSQSPLVSTVVNEYDNAKFMISGANYASVHGVDETIECQRCGRLIQRDERRAKSVKTGLIYCIQCKDSNDFVKGDSMDDMRELSPSRTKWISKIHTGNKDKASPGQGSQNSATTSPTAPGGSNNQGSAVPTAHGNNQSQSQQSEAEKRAALRREALEEMSTGPHATYGKVSSSVKRTQGRLDDFQRRHNEGAKQDDGKLDALFNNQALDLDISSEQDRNFVVGLQGVREAMDDVDRLQDKSLAYEQELGKRFNARNLNIIKLPDELKGYIDYETVHDLIAEGQWEALAQIIADSWVHWYEETGQRSENPDFVGGYSPDRVDDLRAESASMVTVVEQNAARKRRQKDRSTQHNSAP